MLLNKAYYTFKFLLPRRLQIGLRRYYVNWKRSQHADIWPIDPNAAQPLSPLFPAWPDGKKFALVLTHDVETAEGLDKCYQLAEIALKELKGSPIKRHLSREKTSLSKKSILLSFV